MSLEVTVVGGGLAGCELALQLARRGFTIHLIEMRPVASTEAHTTPLLAELVCSNSLKSDHPETASGLLKRELRLFRCVLLETAAETSVPAGHALAVDRVLFARRVTELVERETAVRLERREIGTLDLPLPCVIATGPLTTAPLVEAMRGHFGADHLFFYDAISISVSAETIDDEMTFRGSRYGKGGDDYRNIPLSPEEYAGLVRFLKSAPTIEKHGFEQRRCFEACLPVEVIASRGDDALRFGPLKPKGLPDPRTGREPYAVIQLRQETRDGTMLGLVGFQTRLARHAQRELISMIPALCSAEILRYGSVHRNTFIDSPRLLDPNQMSRTRGGLFFSGQIVGVEGYVESIAHGLLTSLAVIRRGEGNRLPLLPRESLLGSLQRHCAEAAGPFQPTNVNYGLLPPIGGPKRQRKRALAERSLECLDRFVREHSLGR